MVLGRRYQLTREIARGGMAAVWEAEDTALGRRVAIKLLHAQFANEPEFLERFRREARAAASLSHPNVVSVYDVSAESDLPFLVLELVEGETLKDRIRHAAPLPDSEIRRVGAAVASTLDYAHRRGIIHRDVKPQNILLGDDGRPRLADFGIAQALVPSGLTRTGAVMGTVHYLAPELVRGKTATPASDVYSLGAVLYEMATGRLPFSGETDLAVALAHVEETPVPPRTLNARVAPDLERTILRALAKAPEQRFLSAADFARALQSVGAAPPAPPGPPRADAVTQRIPVAPTPAPVAAAPAAVAAYTRPAPAVADRPYARTRVAAAPRRGGGGLVALLLTMAAVLVVLGAGFFGLATLSREGVLPPEPTAAPTARPTTASKPAGVPTTAPTAAPTAAPSATPEPTAAPPATPTPAPPSPTPAPPTPTRVPPTPTVRTITVPQLRGRTLQQAQAAIATAGLTVTVRGDNVNADRDVVAQQSPEAGNPLPPNGTVSIVVGTGNTAIPNVTGRPRAEAARILQDNSFRVTVRERRDPRVPAGQAIETRPDAGTPHERRAEVDLFVSTGG
jgi:serine/threonine-protein kinase